MEFINHLFFSFISTFGFAVMFNIPKKQIFSASMLGSTGWLIFHFYSVYSSTSIISAFWGSLAVGILGEFLARYKKQPATIFIIPGIIPLVPGAGMYYTMDNLVQNKLTKAAEVGIETFMIALSIAIGIILATSVSKVLKKNNKIIKSVYFSIKI